MCQRPEPRRADARRSRERLLAAAREALASDADASLNTIAKQAGVGAGTLYRHFPSREALIIAVYRQDVQELVDLAPRLLAEHPPLTALRRWLDRLARYGQIKHSLGGVLRAVTSDGLAGETYGPVIGAITLLLRAGQGAGTLRPGVGPEDILLLLGFLWRIEPGPDWAAQTGRLLDVVMDGLQAGEERR